MKWGGASNSHFWLRQYACVAKSFRFYFQLGGLLSLPQSRDFAPGFRWGICPQTSMLTSTGHKLRLSTPCWKLGHSIKNPIAYVSSLQKWSLKYAVFRAVPQLMTDKKSLRGKIENI